MSAPKPLRGRALARRPLLVGALAGDLGVETLVLDPARRLVLVQVDDEERLILLGEGRELIEPRGPAITTDWPGWACRAQSEATPSPCRAKSTVSSRRSVFHARGV